MAFTKLSSIVSLPRFGANGKERYTDTNEFLSPGVLIAFKKRENYPSKTVKTAINAAAIQARNAIRIANDEMARVCLQRKKETPYFTKAMTRHFNLKADGDKAENLLVDNTVDKPFSPKDLMKHDRRWALEQIRRKMLSLSFHLNTGVYLIDQDNAERDVDGGVKIPKGTANADTNEAYVFPWSGGKNSLCGFRNGEIHVEFGMIPGYSLTSAARIIIHEAAHKFLDADDVDPGAYAWDTSYPQSLSQCLKNADSYAWTAISLATGRLCMPTDDSKDWKNCPGSKL